MDRVRYGREGCRARKVDSERGEAGHEYEGESDYEILG